MSPTAQSSWVQENLMGNWADVMVCDIFWVELLRRGNEFHGVEVRISRGVREEARA